MRGKTPADTPATAKQRTFRSVRFGSFRFYIALIAVIVGLQTVDSVIVDLPMVVAQPEKELATSFQMRQLDLWSEMNKLLIAFATVTIGAIGGFMLQRDKAHPLSLPQLRRAATSWFLCATSLYFGYLSYQQATQMLKHGVFDPLTARLWWPARAQFWAFLVSLILFGDFVYTSIRDKGVDQ
jgi:hypothetical protein